MLSVLVGKPGSALEDITSRSYFKFILVHWWLAFMAYFVQYFKCEQHEGPGQNVLLHY